MTSNKKRSKSTFRGKYRKSKRIPRNRVLGFYGRIVYLGKCVAYCDLHKCYLEPMDIKERNCNIKHCKNLKELGKHKDIER